MKKAVIEPLTETTRVVCEDGGEIENFGHFKRTNNCKKLDATCRSLPYHTLTPFEIVSGVLHHANMESN